MRTKFAGPRRTTLIDGDLKEVLAASAPAGPLEVADDPCQVILSATGLVARTAAESEEATEGRRRNGRTKHDAVRAVIARDGARTGAAGHQRWTGVQDRRAAAAGAARAGRYGLARAAGCPRPSCCRCCRGSGSSASRHCGSPTRPRRGWPWAPATAWSRSARRSGRYASDEFEVIGLRDGDEVVGATWLTDGAETLTFVSSDAVAAALRREAGPPAGPQGRRDGRDQPARGGVRWSSSVRCAPTIRGTASRWWSLRRAGV